MKKIISFFCLISMLFAFTPVSYANTYVNQAFVGTYLSAGATETNYGMLNILSCDENSVAVEFKFIKNGNEQLLYTCSPGVMNDSNGTVRFQVRYTDGSYVANGTMNITFEKWCVKLSCDSDNGQHLFDGTMKPQFDLNPYDYPDGTQTVTPDPFITMNPGITVMLNSQQVTFPEGINPVIINDHTYVPLRSVFDKMGINVYWDQYKKNFLLNAQQITCTKNNTIVQFARTYNDSGYNVWTLSKWVGNNTDSDRCTKINITELQPTLIGQSSYIPLRVVSEAFGADVGWNDETRVVDIICDTSNSYKYDSQVIGSIEDYSQESAASTIPSEYSSIVADSVPYFSPQAKFYKFTANNGSENVNLKVTYGGYVDVIN